CTNLISLFGTLEDSKNILEMAERYDNDHLRKLATFLTDKIIQEGIDLDSSKFIKV
ncbi:MAG: hypothetical protein K1060chlam4_01485, partial [Candidatus Anoxychlamydiales bacterium]|nr:hypothetical protein [Candidatus Anoxychlamydiales bacterium]